MTRSHTLHIAFGPVSPLWLLKIRPQARICMSLCHYQTASPTHCSSLEAYHLGLSSILQERLLLGIVDVSQTPVVFKAQPFSDSFLLHGSIRIPERCIEENTGQCQQLPATEGPQTYTTAKPVRICLFKCKCPTTKFVHRNMPVARIVLIVSSCRYCWLVVVAFLCTAAMKTIAAHADAARVKDLCMSVF
jgi:hypothetical protein